MKVEVWTNWAKKHNSTAAPSYSPNVMEVTLKDSCTLDQPVFLIQADNIDPYMEITYLRAFNHYYFITSTDIITTHLIQLSCNIDRLATYKGAILGTTAKVLYSSNQYDHMITDPRVTTKGTIRKAYKTLGTSLDDSGSYVMICASKTNTFLGVGAYSFDNSSGVASVVSELWADNCIDALKNSLMKPADAIRDIYYLPIKKNAYSSGTDTVFFGNYNSTVTAGLVKFRYAGIVDNDIAIPWSSAQHDFQTKSQYSSIILYLPLVGTVTLDPNTFFGQNSIHITGYMDVLTGDVVYAIKDTNSKIIASYSANCKSEVPWSYVNKNVAGVISNTVSAVSSFARGDIMGGISDTASAVVDAVQPQTHSFGGVTSAISVQFGTDIVLSLYTQEFVEDINSMVAIQGRPCFKTLPLSSCTGYVQTSGASVKIAGHEEDSTSINAMLDNGIFIE